MADETTSDRAAALAKDFMNDYLEAGAERDFKPYVNLIVESLGRCMKLVTESEKTEKEMSSEMLRAVVVLNHAYLEDFLRTLALAFLPNADEKTLDGVPLAGLGRADRAEKFYLGKLVRHRGKTVDEVIIESVSEHMERSTFSSVTEIMSFLDSIGLKLPDGKDKSPKAIPEFPWDAKTLPMLDAMMKRRHHIVHRADKAKTGEGLQAINPGEVVAWLGATLIFTFNAAHAAFRKRYSFEEFKKNVGAMKEAIEKNLRGEKGTA